METDPDFEFITANESTIDKSIEKIEENKRDVSESKITTSTNLDNLDKKKKNLKKICELRDIVNAAYN